MVMMLLRFVQSTSLTKMAGDLSDNFPLEMSHKMSHLLEKVSGMNLYSSFLLPFEETKCCRLPSTL